MFLGKICHLVRTIFLCSAFRSIYILKCIHISAHFRLGLPLFARGSYPPLFRLFFFYLSLESKVLKNPKSKISWLHWQRFCILPSTAHWQLKYLSWLPSGFTGFCSCLVPTLTWGCESLSPDSEGWPCFCYRFSHTLFRPPWRSLTVRSVQWLYHQTSSDQFSFSPEYSNNNSPSMATLRSTLSVLQEKTAYIN